MITAAFCSDISFQAAEKFRIKSICLLDIPKLHSKPASMKIGIGLPSQIFAKA
jgi:hypothetical protein